MQATIAGVEVYVGERCHIGCFIMYIIWIFTIKYISVNKCILTGSFVVLKPSASPAGGSEGSGLASLPGWAGTKLGSEEFGAKRDSHQLLGTNSMFLG